MKIDPLPKRYLTRHELCHYLGICLKSVEKLMTNEEFPTIRILTEYRFDIYAIDAWMASNRIEKGSK